MLFQLTILCLQVGIGGLNLAVLDAAVRQNSQLNVALLVAGVESHLCRYGVRQQALRQQALELAGQKVLTQHLLHELPVFVDAVVLLQLLTTLRLQLLVVSQELGELRGVETTRLLIDKRSLHQQGIGTGLQHVLQLLVGHGETYLLGLSLDDGVADILLPNLILHLIEFLLREIVATLSHLDSLLILVDKTLEVLHRNFLT